MLMMTPPSGGSVPWRGGGGAPRGHLSCSYGHGIRAPAHGVVSWVDTCAWARLVILHCLRCLVTRHHAPTSTGALTGSIAVALCECQTWRRRGRWGRSGTVSKISTDR